MIEDPNASVPADKQAARSEVGRPTGTKQIPQETSSSALFSRKNIQKIVYQTEKLRDFAYSSMRKHSKKKRLNKNEKLMVDELCESVIIAEEPCNWEDKIAECIRFGDSIEKLGILDGVQAIADNHGLGLYSAALLYHG